MGGIESEIENREKEGLSACLPRGFRSVWSGMKNVPVLLILCHAGVERRKRKRKRKRNILHPTPH